MQLYYNCEPADLSGHTKETMANFVPDINSLDALVGRTGKFMWTGMMVHGTITAAYVEHGCAVIIEYDMDEPHVWGSDTYTHDSVWGRLSDNFGPLHYTELD